MVNVARDYLSSLDYFQTSRLPAVCHPRKLLNATDLTAYAFDLVCHQFEVQDPNLPLVTNMAAFFAHASNRLAHIALITNDPDGAQARQSA